MSIEVGDLVETHWGEARIVDIDAAADQIITENLATGICLTWRAEEVEEIAEPAWDDAPAVERWLRIKAVMLKSLSVETETIRCLTNFCQCQHCYVVVTRLTGHDMKQREETQHFTNTQVCDCWAATPQGLICPCVAR